ncbi:MAG: hypothetical protein J6Q93_07255, partial [Prevotella sp.]|nr:hypothetical protein [Prevotella sp.]
TDDSLYDTADTTFNGTGSVSRTDVGTSSLGLTATDFVNTNANFAVTYLVTDGWVKINTLNIESASATLEIKLATNPIYNGSEQTLAVESISCNGLPVTYTVSGNKQTNAGAYTLTVTVNGNFSGQKSMDWSILKRSVTLTSGSASKVYDGTPLTKHEVAVSGDGFVAGEGASYAYSGSQTVAGLSDNAFSYTLNANTLASNYVITTVNGKLTVTQSVIKPEDIFGSDPAETPLLCEKTYNGVAQPVEVVPEFDEEYTFLWSLNGENESSYSETAPTLKNVADGELLVYFKMVTANFEPYYGKVIFKILPKELTEDMVVLTDEAFFFDPDSGQKTPSVTVADTLADGTVISTTADYEIAYGDSTSAGAIPVIVTAKNNYYGEITKTFDVLKRPVAPPVIGAKAYNGRTQKATITTDSRWKVVENNGGINAGEYDVILRLTNTSDYMWKGLDNDAAEWTGIFVIRKANNGWSRYPGINSWTSGETPSEPVGQPRYGELSIAYRHVGASIATETVTKPTTPGKYIA